MTANRAFAGSTQPLATCALEACAASWDMHNVCTIVAPLELGTARAASSQAQLHGFVAALTMTSGGKCSTTPALMRLRCSWRRHTPRSCSRSSACPTLADLPTACRAPWQAAVHAFWKPPFWQGASDSTLRHKHYSSNLLADQRLTECTLLKALFCPTHVSRSWP